MLNFKLPTLVKVFVLAAFLVAAIQVPASAKNMQKLMLVNETGQHFSSIIIGGGDCLQGAGLGDGEVYTIMYDADISKWKITVNLDDGTSLKYNCNLSGAQKLIFYTQDSQIKVSKLTAAD